MQINTRRQARLSALSNRTPSSGSDLTDIDDAKEMVEAMLATNITPTGSRRANSDSELSELSEDDADASSAAEEQGGLEETEEEDSEEDNCEYSAYHGSDSEVSLNSSKKLSHSAKRHSKVIPRSTEGENNKAPPQLESVNPSTCSAFRVPPDILA
jgi:hypothetical protein